MPSFDVVSQIDQHEVDNACNQTRKEITQRYDFKGTESSIEKTDDGIVIVSLKSLDTQPAQQAGGSMWRQLIKLKEGVSKEKAKEIAKAIKDSKIKVQAAIQGDSVRVSGKKRDDLQATIAFLKEKDFDLPLQFTNFRD